MNFFQHQAQARSQTKWLVFMFALAVGAIVAAIDFVLWLALSASDNGQHHGHYAHAAQQDYSGALVAASFAVIALIAIASLVRSATLRSGGGAVARGLGAVLVPPEARDPRYRRLRNVVEELAIASGTPVPEIYVMEGETAINAFAAGWSPADAAITVTRGALDKLDRDELQGVIAHEFSHVTNGDMRLSIRLMGVLFGILVLSVIAREIFLNTRTGGSRKNDGAAAIIAIALAVWIIGSIGQFFGRMIKATISRQRELLADACAVQFTRQNQGIAGALKKIAGLEAGSKLHVGRGEEVSHMLFCDGGFSSLFATHPPLLERIRILDPAFKPDQIGAIAARVNDPGYEPADTSAVAAGFAGAETLAVTRAGVTAQVGNPSPDAYAAAAALHAALPGELRAAAGDAASAWPLIFALLLDADAGVRGRQLQLIEKSFGASTRAAAQALRDAAAALPPEQRLPLVSLTFPALKTRSREELRPLLEAVSQLIRADGVVTLQEFCLGHLLRTQVADAINPTRAKAIGRRKLGDARSDALTLLAALAHCGTPDVASARRAFIAGAGYLYPREPADYQPPADPVAALEQVLPALDALDAPGKELLIGALVETLAFDNRITVSEAELLRVICAALHCPLPPLLAAA
ncbi:MAG TPA: M48 family metallopeptidase [Nevskiaceae bacterium]|nr:M48 family metallopeptidase [Nevskiaceae bacterium]